jgi:hypothetical protein
MKLAILMALFSVYCQAQQKRIEHPEILLLDIGTSKWPIKLTKHWFEDDTVYTLTFRNAKSKSFQTTDQGFFKPEFKKFAKALQMALSIDSCSEVEFSEGVIAIMPGKIGKREIECHFANGNWIFRANETIVKKIICAIRKE